METTFLNFSSTRTTDTISPLLIDIMMIRPAASCRTYNVYTMRYRCGLQYLYRYDLHVLCATVFENRNSLRSRYPSTERLHAADFYLFRDVGRDVGPDARKCKCNNIILNVYKCAYRCIVLKVEIFSR